MKMKLCMILVVADLIAIETGRTININMTDLRLASPNQIRYLLMFYIKLKKSEWKYLIDLSTVERL